MDTLPNEVLLQILSYSTYWDLKLHIRPVCRRLNSLISTQTCFSDVDRLLFRDRPKSTTTTRSSYEVHPIFRRRWLCFDARTASNSEDMYIIRPTHAERHRIIKKFEPEKQLFEGRLRLSDTEVVDEHMLSPSVKKIYLQVGEFPFTYPLITLKGKEGKGVTVSDTIEGCFEALRWKERGVMALYEENVDCPFLRPVVTIKVVGDAPQVHLSFALSLRGLE